MKEKILVTGASGLVGSRFVELYQNKNLLLTPDLNKLDITNKDSFSIFIEDNSPGTVINFAAFTDVNAAELQREDKNGSCWLLNTEAVEKMLDVISDKDIHFIQISTDMVFTGQKDDPGPYGENHPQEKDRSKLTWYAYSKLEAEKLVGFSDNASVVRIIYPARAKYDFKLDYLRKPLKLFDEGKLYPAFTDQKITITFIDEIVKPLAKIIENKLSGVFHVCSSNTSTPFEIISYLLEKARGAKNVVQKGDLSGLYKKDQSNKIRYPMYHGLSVNRSEELLKIKFMTTKEIIDELVDQGITY